MSVQLSHISRVRLYLPLLAPRGYCCTFTMITTVNTIPKLAKIKLPYVTFILTSIGMVKVASESPAKIGTAFLEGRQKYN